MTFDFATARRIVFGSGKLPELGPVAAGCGRRALLVTGASDSAAARAEPLLRILAAAGVATVRHGVSGEPTIADALAGAEAAREAGCELVIGFGGGSAVDAGKAVAALLTNPGDPLDYLEVIGRGHPLVNPPAPYLAVPTTAGTGAEVTRNAVLRSPEHRVKVSLRSPLMLPDLALVDPELTLGLPPEVTATTGLDALTQLIEPFVSCRANPFTDAVCREGLPRAARSLRRACHDGDLPAREDLALASLFGGLALANAGLGAVHGFAAPLGGRYPAPHGAVCAALLAPVMAANLQALLARGPAEPLDRYDEAARLLTGSSTATADDGVAWVAVLVKDLAIPPLSAYGVTADEYDLLAEQAAAASSMKGNPVQLTPDELRGVLAAAG